MQIINLLVEGDLDEAVGRRLLRHYGAGLGVTWGKQGSGYIKAKVQAFARSSVSMPLLALVDLMDTGLPCAPEVVANWLPHCPSTVLFRVVVREIESWVMADRVNLADHFGIPIARIPNDPDNIRDPKQTLIQLARQSRHRAIREGVVPSMIGATTGPLYNSIMVGFVRDSWDPEIASSVSPSLGRASRALADLLRNPLT